MAGFETLALIGTAISAAGSVAGGFASSAQQKAQAKALEMRANEERAVAQREAQSRRKQADLIMSRQQALAADSGGGATDPTILDLMGDTAAQSYVNSGTAIAEGETRGRGLEYQAKINRQAGKQAILAGFIDAGSTMLSGMSEFSKYRSKKLPTLSSGYTYGG